MTWQMVNGAVQHEKWTDHNDMVTDAAKILAMVVLSMVLVVLPARAETPYRLATGPVAGNYHPVGIALATLLKLKRDEGLTALFDVDITTGAEANLRALLTGEADVAFVDAATLLAAISREPPYDSFNNIGSLRTLARLWPSAGHLTIRDSLARKGTIQDFRSLIGEPVAFGSNGSASAVASKHLFSANGLFYDKLFSIPSLDLQQSVDAFSSDVINGFSLFSFVGDQRIASAFSDVDHQATLLSVSQDQLDKMNDGTIPIWRTFTIPENTYPNQIQAVDTVVQDNFLITRADLPDIDAQHITRTIFKNLTFLKALHPAAAHMSDRQETQKLIVPFHTGTEKFVASQYKCSGLSCFFDWW